MIFYNSSINSEITEVNKKILYSFNQNSNIIKKFNNMLQIKYVSSSWYFSSTTGIIFGSPYIDAVSTLPADWDFRVMDFYTTPMNRNDSEVFWVDEPFVTLGGQGWIMNALSLLIDSNKNKLGILTFDISLEQVLNIEIKENAFNILLLSQSSKLLGQSNISKRQINFFDSDLSRFDYFEQLSENPQLQENLKLLHTSRSKDQQELGRLILSKAEKFKLTIADQKYIFISKEIPELKLYIVGYEKIK